MRSSNNSKLRELSALYERVFSSPDGKAVLQHLESVFNGTTLKKVDGRVDRDASMAKAGSREVLLYIQLMRNRNVVD